MKKSARLVFIPAPGMGHLVSTIEFAKLLTNHDDRLWITVLVINLPLDTTTSTYTQSLVSFSERVDIINLPECPSNSESTSMTTLLEQLKPHVKQAVSNLPSDTPLTAFVVDMFCTTMIEVAKHFNVPSLIFFTSGVSLLSLMLHLHTLREQDNTEFRDNDTELVVPCFTKPVPSTALPSSVLSNEFDQLFLAYGRGLKKADGIIVNSFQELESYAVHSFSNGPLPIYPVGPIINPKPEAQVETNNTHIFDWLDQQPPSSVVFLCFGSMGALGEDQVREIAHALENSGAHFLWSLRKPPPGATIFVGRPSDYDPSDLATILPSGFLDRTAGIGKVIGWANQTQVLAHPATGGFVSHCGWNSILESIYFGVPIATWPLFAEQQTNAFLLVRELNMAVEIALDYRVDFKAGNEPNTLLSADKIEEGIRSLLDINPDTRKRVKEMSEKSRNTLLEGGCSFSYLGRLIDYIMNQDSLVETAKEEASSISNIIAQGTK